MLCLVFFVQHSGMVRRSFRAWLEPLLPRDFHPATYAIASGLALAAVVLLWQPAETLLWAATGWWRLPPRIFFLLAIAGFVWGVRALGDFDTFGLAPLRAGLRGRPLPPPSGFTLRGPYLWVRHPLYLFMLVLIWAGPDLTADRLLFNVLWTAWIVLGSRWEERDLVVVFGDAYRRYQETVPMLLPWRGPAGRRIGRGAL
jgi:protein-S-isoprenylcysteine O-methyltransferase Ste14